MPFTSAMLLGVASGGFDAVVTFSSFSSGSGTGTVAGFSSTPVIVDDPDSIMGSIIYYGANNAGIKLENGQSYEATVISNYTTATSGSSIVVGELTHDGGSEFQNYNLQRTIGTLFDGSSFNNFSNAAWTCSTSGAGYGPTLVVKHSSTGSHSASTLLKLGITKTS